MEERQLNNKNKKNALSMDAKRHNNNNTTGAENGRGKKLKEMSKQNSPVRYVHIQGKKKKKKHKSEKERQRESVCRECKREGERALRKRHANTHTHTHQYVKALMYIIAFIVFSITKGQKNER